MPVFLKLISMDIRHGMNRTLGLLSVVLMTLVVSPYSVQAQDANLTGEFSSDPEVTRSELISVLELQYQITLSLPYTPSTDAGLAALDMAIAGLSSASPEDLAVLQPAGPAINALMANVKELDELVRAEQSRIDSSKSRSVVSSAATFDCDGFVELAGELERPPGYCNQSDTQVAGIDYLPFGSNDELFLSDNVYPDYPLGLCTANIPPEITALLLLDALAAENLALIASRGCNQAIFFFASGGNASLGCIVTDLINLGFQHLSEGAQFCNSIRSASEGRTTYVRAGELFVQSSENTEFVDNSLVDGFDALSGDIDKIQAQACQNAVRLNETIAQLNDTLRSIRIDNARLLELFGDLLDPINPVPVQTVSCLPVAVPGGTASTEPNPGFPPPAQPPVIPPAQPDNIPVTPTQRERIGRRDRQ